MVRAIDPSSANADGHISSLPSRQHGVKRTKLSKEDQDEKRAEDAEQIKQYRTLVDDCLTRVSEFESTCDAHLFRSHMAQC
jgi:hypothetical protein